MGGMRSSRTFLGTAGADIEETDERYGGMGDRLSGEAGDGMSGGRREEEDHVEGYQL